MSVTITKSIIKNKHFTFNCMHFVPEKYDKIALFTHGYTANKSDCISWATRLSDKGFACSIFDLPGHYLGSYNEVKSFDSFKENAHLCFIDVFQDLRQYAQKNCESLILGGHSLGALLSLKASNIKDFEAYNLKVISVGLGLNLNVKGHLFNSDFYEKTLHIRNQFVSPELHSNFVFPWIQEEKKSLELSGKRIHMITGKDDVVVGKDGMQNMASILSANNMVSTAEPTRLPHHEPSMASSYIVSFVKKEFNL